MGKNNNIKITFFIILITILILISNSISSTIIKKDEQNFLQRSSLPESYIDPLIKLTANKHLQKLETLLNNIDDMELKLFITELIGELNKDGEVNSQDIRLIRDKNGIFSDWNYYSGFLIGNCGNDTIVKGFPRRPHLITPIDADSKISWFGPGLLLRWDVRSASKNINLYVGMSGHEINDHHKGIAFLQFGYWEEIGKKNGYWFFDEYIFSVAAISPLIIINLD